MLDALENGDFGELLELQKKSSHKVPRPSAESVFSRLEGILAGDSASGGSKASKVLLQRARTELQNFLVSPMEFTTNGLVASRGEHSIFEGEYAKNQIFVLKVPLHNNAKEIIPILRELCILKKLRHDLIVLLLGISLDEENNLWVLTEPYSQFSLAQVLAENQLSLETKFKIVFQVAQALMHLHSLSPKIVFRNVQPSAFRLDREGNVKIADFSLAYESGSCPERLDLLKLTDSNFSTLEYLSPESLSDSIGQSESDVYAFGVLLFSTFVGKAFSNKQGQSLVNSILVERYRPELANLSLPEDLKKLIARCWADEHNKRPLFDDICEQLHKMLSGLVAAV